MWSEKKGWQFAITFPYQIIKNELLIGRVALFLHTSIIVLGNFLPACRKWVNKRLAGQRLCN
jgi:hypothetical protein